MESAAQPRLRDYDHAQHNTDGAYAPDMRISIARNWQLTKLGGRPSKNLLASVSCTAVFERLARAVAHAVRSGGRCGAADAALISSHPDLDLALSAVPDDAGWLALRAANYSWQRSIKLTDDLMVSALAYRDQLAAEKAAAIADRHRADKVPPSGQPEPKTDGGIARTTMPPKTTDEEMRLMEAAMDAMAENDLVVEDDEGQS